MEKQLLEEEINQLKDLEKQNNQLIFQFGEIEMASQVLVIKKEELTKNLLILKENERTLGKLLTEKYGDGSIDMETGKFISI